jgi:hypothetical protein
MGTQAGKSKSKLIMHIKGIVPPIIPATQEARVRGFI